MATPRGQRRGGVVAAVVTVGGVLVIWAMSSMHQEDQTRELSRQWVGEQWDVARNCLLGTPIGRGASEEEIASSLEERLLRTLSEASEAEAPPDPDALWPARCVPILASLRVDRSILRSDPGNALDTLEVLLPRVVRVGPDGPAMLALGDARERVRELAAPIAALDRAMPHGAEHDAARYPPEEPPIPAAAVLRSMTCTSAPAPRRPFFDARLTEGVLFDEIDDGGRAMRLSANAPEGPYRLSIASPSGTEMRDVEGGRHPRFWSASTLLWLSGSTLRRAPIDGTAETIEIDIADADAMSVCRPGGAALEAGDDGGVGHVFVRSGDDVRWVRIDGVDTRAPIPVRPAPPSSGPVVACSEEVAVLAWTDDDGRWTGALCRERTCRALPILNAGGDLRLAVQGTRVLAVARGRRTDLSLGRVLLDDEELAWGEPVVVARGGLRATADGFAIDACEDPLASSDGRAWSLPQ